MKVYTISVGGIKPATPEVVNTDRGAFFTFNHGEEGRGRWQYRLPLAAREFPVPQDEVAKRAETARLSEAEFRLIPLNREDSKGNPLYLLTAGQPDGHQLILWWLSPGFRGGASYEVTGQAKILAEGHEAQGDAGRMGGAPCPIVLVTGPCRLTWQRYGRLYGKPAKWVAEFDGAAWTVAPEDDCALENAALDY